MNRIFFCKIITLFWICVIFSFSLQPASKSEVLSDGVGQMILEYSSEETIEKADSWSLVEWKMFHKLVRKAAHFTEFFILGICMILALDDTKVINKSMIGILLCMLVASMDESIQLFVPGRAARIMDVMIDSFGSITGIAAVTLIKSIVWKRRRK